MSPCRLRRLLLLGLLCGLGSAQPVRAEDGAHWKSPGYLVDAFVEIALRNEYSPKRGLVRKWTSPISYFVLHRVGDERLHQYLVDTHLEQLARITGVSIRPVLNPAAANYLIVMTGEDRLKDDLLSYFGWRSASQREKFYRETVCLAIFSTKPKGPIISAVAMIAVDRARARGALASCVVEELTQVMGLPNDSVKVFPSIFNDLSTDVFLSGLDYLLLQMLYDPRVKPGMDETTVRPILRTIAGEYESEHRFDSAEKMVAEEGLAGSTNWAADWLR